MRKRKQRLCTTLLNDVLLGTRIVAEAQEARRCKTARIWIVVEEQSNQRLDGTTAAKALRPLLSPHLAPSSHHQTEYSLISSDWAHGSSERSSVECS